MENNYQYDELLIKYLANELTAERHVFVESWIKASEQNSEYFKRLAEVWNLADATHTLKQLLEMNMDEKWNRFKQDVTAKEAKIISPEQHEELKKEIRQEERKGQHSIVYKILVSTAIAASVLLFISLGWKFFVNNKQEIQAGRNTPVENVNFRHVINNSGKTKRLVLLDGSVITLSNRSEVNFTEPFAGNLRDITLIGKADFKVAKDASKPFTVYSLGLATTALGTHFTVSAFRNSEEITIKLYEGKIVVKSVDAENIKLKNDCYLLPGQQLIYNNKKYTATLLNIRIKDPVLQDSNNAEVLDDDSLASQNATGSWNMFNNQSLEKVFDQLELLYDVKIIYDKKDLQNKHFIGRFDKSDNINVILNHIGSLNDLKITNRNDTFIISK